MDRSSGYPCPQGEKAQEGGVLLEAAAAEVRTDQAIRMLNSELGDEVDVNENHGLCKGHFYVVISISLL